METRDGTDYAQNYDIIVKLMADALKGETLEVIGVKTGIITDVFGFEPVDISVTAGRVDVMMQDETGAYYHFEEQQNFRKKHMYRFGAYHFMGAEKWGAELTDIILASGNVTFKKESIKTRSGRYKPVIIDFSKRNGWKRLEEIRAAVRNGTFDKWLELVFLPLYGKETGEARSDMVKEMIRFQADLFHGKKISSRLLAATMIMSNKMVGKAFFEEIWKEVKMLDIIDFAMEKGKKEGRQEGLLEGLLEAIEMGLSIKFGVGGLRLLPLIQQITDIHRLDMIKKIIKATDDLSEVEASLN